VRVPVFIGHSEALNIEFEEEISAAEARTSCAKPPA
jgi:aspartate-semialdehyde dehydrogenase